MYMMDILMLISNYEREDMLSSLIEECESNGVDYYIIDDCSSYTIHNDNCRVLTDHRGKKGYWQTFSELMGYCEGKEYDLFIFSPNDFSNYNFDGIREYASLLGDNFVLNTINDGRTSCFNHKGAIQLSEDLSEVFFTDCGFTTTYSVLKQLKFRVNPINRMVSVNQSSGVGRQLTDRLNNLDIDMYLPTKSLAFHGDHPSVMNYEERIKNPLISR